MSSVSSVRRAIVHHPEDAARRTVRLVSHDVFDEAVKGRDAGPRLAPPKEARPVDVPRRDVRPGAASAIFVLDAQRAAGRNGRGRVATLPDLNAGLFIRRDHVVARPQRAPVPAPLVQIQDRAGAFGEPRIAGKSQVRWRHGRIASASNQRQIVVPLTVATSPRANTSRCRSGNDQRASGTPASIGRSQAIRFTSTTTLGGKAGWSPASQRLVEARKALVEEPVAPLADDLPRGIQTRRDDIVGQSLGGQQDKLRADDVSIR